MKKLSLLALSLIFLLFAGCAANDDEEEVDTTAGDTTSADTTPSDTGDTAADTGDTAADTGDTAADTGDTTSDTGDTAADTAPDTGDTGSITTFCTPGTRICGPMASGIYLCNADGSAPEAEPIETCGEGLSCLNGDCQPGACLSGNGYEGCEFYTAKLNNLSTSKDSFSIAFANSTDQIATIRFYETTGEGTEIPIQNFEYCERVTKSSLFGDYDDMDCKKHESSFTITVPAKDTVMITPTKEDRIVKKTGSSYLSYHIKSDIPIIAYQFNPSYNNSYSNDASLLLPVTRLGIEYYVASYEDQNGYDGNGAGYFTIVGAYQTNVELEITPTAAIPAQNGIPGTSPGVPMVVELKAGQVLNIENANKFDDFTGTRVACKNPNQNCAPFVVFGGHACAYVPRSKGYCDHLEHQLLPTSRWGRNYVVVKSKPRSYARDFVRVIAANDQTSVTVGIKDDSNKNGSEKTVVINKGDKYEFELKQHDDGGDWFKPGSANITADKPVEVVQYLTGAEDIGGSCADDGPGSSHSGCMGDPAMTIVPPVEQFRQEYYFFSAELEGSSSDDATENFVSVVAAADAEITLNESSPSPRFTGTIYNTNMVYYVFDIDSYFMNHHLTCSKPCGIQIYGWNMDISYMYVGGLDLKMLQ